MMPGNSRMTFVYRLEERPQRTIVTSKDVESPYLLNAGGSWTYEEKEYGTLWTQKNTVSFHKSFLLPFILPVLRFVMKRNLIASMQKAKKIMERKSE